MENKNFMTVDEVAQELNVSKSYAYKVVRELNAEMQKLGYLTVTGRVNTSFFRIKTVTNGVSFTAIPIIRASGNRHRNVVLQPKEKRRHGRGR